MGVRWRGARWIRSAVILMASAACGPGVRQHGVWMPRQRCGCLRRTGRRRVALAVGGRSRGAVITRCRWPSFLMWFPPPITTVGNQVCSAGALQYSPLSINIEENLMFKSSFGLAGTRVSVQLLHKLWGIPRSEGLLN